ncbi:MAG: nucleotidyl transferase AbiEii/AbiGii toxin family protein [Oscillospiraceae bacterium]|jgi:predicted nucleotidyltransferase component of viral defense system|nr:nucleotidyl transferase AbiEii/AbiGii toxin family protein [Oscillospiraceae bacterium]
MILHKDVKVFQRIIDELAAQMNLDDGVIIEKDYYVTYFLSEIAKRQPGIIFKGGTFLSKCHKIINRFSEDVDLSVEPKTDKVTESQRKKLKADILEIIEEAGFILENPEDVRSRRDFNQYIINYNSGLLNEENSFLEPNLIVETSVFIKTFPSEEKEVSSLIYHYLKAENADEQIEMYELKPFKMTVQALERTFVDKIFAIADYYMRKESAERLSRHIYDLYKIYPEIKFDETFAKLVAEVREVCKPWNLCVSAQDGVDIQGVLRKIVKEDYYKQDYEQITQNMLFEDVKYESVIKAVTDVIKTGCFK